MKTKEFLSIGTMMAIFICIFSMAELCAAQPYPITTLNLGNSINHLFSASLRAPTVPVPHKTNIGVVVMHPYGSINTQVCTELAKRGFTTLCASAGFAQDTYYGYEQQAPGVASAINYLKYGSPKVTTVLLFGHSAGGPLMAFYQNIAENGAAACQGPEKIIPCVAKPTADTDLDDIPEADGVMLFDSHLGEGFAVMTYIDPAMNKEDCEPRNPEFDMFSAENGYDVTTNGATYSTQFKKTFTTHQAIRNNDLLIEAINLLKDKIRSTGDPTQLGDDIPFNIPGCRSARLFQPDTTLLKYTKKEHTLLSRFGARPVQIIESVRAPQGDAARGLDCDRSTRFTNVHIWLGTETLRVTPGLYTQTENSITGIDFASSATSANINVQGITKPVVIVANTGHYFVVPDEMIYDAAKTSDKTLAYLEGAVHGGTPCLPCATAIDPTIDTQAKANAYWGDTFSRVMDFYAEWIAARYH